MEDNSTSAATAAAASPRPKHAISVGKSRPRRRGPRLSLKRGRPSNIRILTRQRIFALVDGLVTSRTLPEWTRAAMEHLSSWSHPEAEATWDLIALIIGEIITAGVAAAETDDDIPPLLPFDIDDAAKFVDADAPLSGGEAFRVFGDYLYRNVVPLWCDRANEALADPRHRRRSHVFYGFGEIVKATMAAGYTAQQAAIVCGVADVKGKGAFARPALDARFADAVATAPAPRLQ